MGIGCGAANIVNGGAPVLTDNGDPEADWR